MVRQTSHHLLLDVVDGPIDLERRNESIDSFVFVCLFVCFFSHHSPGGSLASDVAEFLGCFFFCYFLCSFFSPHFSVEVEMKRMAVVAVTMAKCEIFADDSSKSNRKSNKLCSCRLRLSLSLSLFFLGAETNFFFKKIIIIKAPSIAYRFDTDRGSKYRTGPTAWTLRDRPKSFFFF